MSNDNYADSIEHFGTVTSTYPLVIDDGDKYVEIAGLRHGYDLGDEVGFRVGVTPDVE